MFGIGKIFGSLFDRLGLGWVGHAIQLAINISTGNWLAVADEVLQLVARFSNNDWLQRVAQVQPLGLFGAGRGGCFNLRLDRLVDMGARLATTGGHERVGSALRLVSEFVQMSRVIERQRQATSLAQAV